MSSVERATKLSHKQFRALLKKFRRKKKRQLLAQERDRLGLLEQHKRESSPNFQAKEEEKRRCSDLWDQFQERESIRKHKAWLLREEQAQIEFKKKQEQLELDRINQEEERKRIVAEFEQQKFVESRSEEEAQKIKSQKEYKVGCKKLKLLPKKLLGALKEVLSNLPQGDGPWHNPIAPQNYLEGTEREQCQFFAKTGCCRFGDRCSRGHIRPSVSNTLLIKGMYTHFSIGQAGRDDFDTDDVLEYEDKERYQDFENFYWDVLPEFKKFGRVVQFKVCCNHEVHLRGNVFVQYSNEEDAVEAYKSFNGRYYAGKQLTCEFSNVIKWRSAICGLFFRKMCPKGIHCNFLHVFKNPGSEFWSADRDFEESARSTRSNQSRRNSEHGSSHTHSNRSHRYRRDDYSPDYSSSRRSSRHRYYDGSTDSESDDQRSAHSSSSSRKHSRKHKHTSSYKSHHKRKHRDSRSRSKSPSNSFSDKEGSSYSKKNKKKKSKKHKKE